MKALKPDDNQKILNDLIREDPRLIQAVRAFYEFLYECDIVAWRNVRDKMKFKKEIIDFLNRSQAYARHILKKKYWNTVKIDKPLEDK